MNPKTLGIFSVGAVLLVICLIGTAFALQSIEPIIATNTDNTTKTCSTISPGEKCSCGCGCADTCGTNCSCGSKCSFKS